MKKISIKNIFSYNPKKTTQREIEDSVVAKSYSSGHNDDLFTEIVSQIEGKDVIDLGCGDGAFGRVLKSRRKDLKLTGLDFLIDKNSNFLFYDNIIEDNFINYNFSNYDTIISNHFFEHLYIQEIISLLEKMRGKKVIISVPFEHNTLCYVKHFLSAADQVDNIKNYKYLIGAMHKTTFDSKLISYLGFKKIKTNTGSQILVKEREINDKDKYQAQLYIISLQEKIIYKVFNNLFFVLLKPVRFIKNRLLP